MKKTRVFLGALLAVILCMLILPANAYGADVVASGTCGAEGGNLTWTFDSDGVLTISGTGAMADYAYDVFESNTPAA